MLESDGTSAYGLSFLTKRVGCVLRQIQPSYNYEHSIQGNITRESFFCFVNRTTSYKITGASLANGVVANQLQSVFDYVNGSYELMPPINADASSNALAINGLTTRLCPELPNFLINTSTVIMPGSTGLQQAQGSWLYQYAQQVDDKKQKYCLRRFCADKFYLPICYGSQDLNKVAHDVDISGMELKQNGNFMNVNITFGSINTDLICYLYAYTIVNQLVHINSSGALKVQR